MTVRYLIRLPDPAAAHGDDPALSFTANGMDAFAEQLQNALRNDRLFELWRKGQDDPDAVDMAFAKVDPNAQVSGEQEDLHIDLTVTTNLPGDVLCHRMNLLAGNHWELRKVSPL
ncbi:MAG: hypothetical protein LBL59_02140 [Xanthomonadaceae bacterium]|jgi:hypothetical protein|nr:hypothetical protein [Xanthomonadaceae bacterium]